jgi:6-phosphogluconate dehydrogenase
MRFGIVGLGRMGGGLARHAMEQGHEVVGYNRDVELTNELAAEGLEPTDSIDELVRKLDPQRVVLIYVPHGPPTDEVCHELQRSFDHGDIAVDGGNSHWADSQRHYAEFASTEMKFLDMGTSGGVSGARNGACFMAGGDEDAYRVVEPLLTDLAVDERGALHVGPPGSGHFVKLIHNAIEFGMVQAIAEGVEMLERSDFPLDLASVFDNWNHGSVIRSWLVELMRDAFRDGPDMSELSTYTEDTGEVKWVLDWALDRDIPSPVISDSQQALMAYRDLDWPAAKAVALLRHGYGGHPLHRKTEQLVRT